MFKLIWLLGWLRPRTATRRLALLAILGGGGLSAGAIGLAATVGNVVADGRAAASGILATVTAAIPGGDSGTAARVTHVVDGDTLDVRMRRDGRRQEVRIRLVGIDTAESKRPGTPIECGALEAEHHLLKLTYTRPVDTNNDGLFDTEGGTARRVTFTEDSSGDAVDRYGRSLGYVTLRGRDRTLQEQLLAAGWADVYVYQGREFDKLDEFNKAARRAKRNDRGVYELCGGDFHRPR